MKICVLILLLLVNGPLWADTRDEIASVLDYFSEVWNEGDLEALNGYYHPDFVLITENGPIDLKERFNDLRTVMQEGRDRGVLETTQVTVKELGEDFALAYAHSSLEFKDGSSLNTWFTTVFRKTPFGWKAILTQSKKN